MVHSIQVRTVYFFLSICCLSLLFMHSTAQQAHHTLIWEKKKSPCFASPPPPPPASSAVVELGMADPMTLRDYALHRDYHGLSFDMADEPTKLLVWSMVMELQSCHLAGNCPATISSTTVSVINGRAHLTATDVPYSKEKAEENYRALKTLIDTQLFGGRGELQSASFKHFLNLMEYEPVSDADFIRRHYCILSTASQLTFLTNLCKCREFMSKSDQGIVIDAIKDAGLPANWDHVMKEHVFFKFVSEHAGKKVTPDKLFRNAGSHLKEYNENHPYPRYTLSDLVKLIHHKFPSLIVNIQYELFQWGMLKRFGIDPFDDIE